MTQTTEQERAEFEKAWRERPIYMVGVHQKEVAYIWWMQAARRAPAVPTRKQIEQYLYEQGAVTVSRKVAEAAGLARLEGKMQSAPAVPVPQDKDRLLAALERAAKAESALRQLIDEAGNEMTPGWEKRMSTCIAQGNALLAAAPQPPEAAQSNSAEFDGIKTKAAPVQLPEYDIDTANHAGIRVRGYTQETVRQLLAAHGIEVAP